MIIYEQITKCGTGATDQPCFYFIKKGPINIRSFRCSDQGIWGIQSTGLPLRTDGQKEPGAPSRPGIIYGFYRKIGPHTDQTYKDNRFIHGVAHQHCSKNGTGGIFIKTRAWQKKRNKRPSLQLSYPAPMTGGVSKDSRRFTVSLFQILNVIIT